MAIKRVSIHPGTGNRMQLRILLDKGIPVDKKEYWWARYPERAAEEIYKMSQNTNSMMQVDGDKLVWFEIITTNFGNDYMFSLETGSGYPFTMPKVFVREPDIRFGDMKHLYSDGSLCLMHADDYSSKMSILEFRNQAVAWCWCADAYKQTGEWPGAERPH